jgi:hypothetical protein
MIKKQIKLKKDINLELQDHQIKLISKLEQVYKKDDGWIIKNIDANKRIVYLENSMLTGENEPSKKTSEIIINLPVETKPSDDNKTREFLEKKYKGTKTPYMLEFDAYKKCAVLGNLTPQEFRVRRAIATALGVKEWDIKHLKTTNKGYLFIYDKYVPSKHEKKLSEVINYSIGKLGWYFDVNYETYEINIIKAELPKFDASYNPINTPNKENPFKVIVGIALGEKGQKNTLLECDFSDIQGLMISGLSGAGKTVFVNNLIFGWLNNGGNLALADMPNKAVDFEWCKNYVKPYHFGCNSRRGNLAVVKMVYDEGLKRGELLKQYGVKKWQELPDNVKKENPPVLLIIDELSGLFNTELQKPVGIPSAHPLMIEYNQDAFIVAQLKSFVTKIASQLRASGIRIVLANQQSQANSGISMPLKTNLANRVLLGGNSNQQARGHAFFNPDDVPEVPMYLRGEKVGVAEFESPLFRGVFKGFYAPDSEFIKHLSGVKTTNTPEPTVEQISKYAPLLEC